ncbi:MAG TPA: hypothetical protein DHV36_05385, partial [Desulfobacteraceae bacterium]|nr:hypothetical protein [Desulfobacteraceae bacterium]
MKIRNERFITTLGRESKRLAEEAKNFITSDPDHYHLLLHIIDHGMMPQDKACRLWADSLGIAWIDLRATLFQPKIVGLMPKASAEKFEVIPVYQMGEAVTLATANPGDTALKAKIEAQMNQKVSMVFALKEDILDAIAVQYQSVDFIETLAETTAISFPVRKTISKEALEAMAGNEAIIELARSLMLLAVQQGASDIHIEPGETGISVRLRIDGVLHEKTRLEKILLSPLISRIKIISGMNITEKRRPQDGRITLELRNRSIGFRVSTVPTVNGEKA